MGLQEVGTALLFYLPFLLTIVIAFFAFTIGIVAIFSGTLLILCFAAYGFYALLRDMGLLELCIQKFHSLWQHMSLDVEKNIQRSFFMKDLQKLPTTTSLFLCHPHGLIGYSWMLHFCYGIHPWPSTKPKPVVAIHSILFRIPIVRDVLEQFHCIEAKEDIIRSYLQQGTSVAIVTGGIEEMLYNGEKKVKLVLQKRKGYARIAKECKVPIVPLFTVGENELFPSESFWLWKGIQGLVYRWTGIHIPLPTWTSMKRWASILRKPLENPIETYVLGILNTHGKTEEKIRTECVAMYETFFERHTLHAKIVA